MVTIFLFDCATRSIVLTAFWVTGESEPEDACGSDSCINRMLYLECNEATCPSGYYCKNMRFQRRQYAQLEIFDAGGKGYGLKTVKDIRSYIFQKVCVCGWD
jgi:hypothetical protein